MRQPLPSSCALACWALQKWTPWPAGTCVSAAAEAAAWSLKGVLLLPASSWDLGRAAWWDDGDDQDELHALPPRQCQQLRIHGPCDPATHSAHPPTGCLPEYASLMTC